MDSYAYNCYKVVLHVRTNGSHLSKNTVGGDEQILTDNYKYIYKLRGKNKLDAVIVMLRTFIRQARGSNPDGVTTNLLLSRSLMVFFDRAGTRFKSRQGNY
jgi:hypothetical protein